MNNTPAYEEIVYQLRTFILRVETYRNEWMSSEEADALIKYALELINEISVADKVREK